MSDETNESKEQAPEIGVYHAVDFYNFSGVAYMPALEAVSKESTCSRHELPTFYVINDSLVFFHPKLKNPLMFISGDVNRTLNIIINSLASVFKTDTSLDVHSKGEKKSLEEKKYKFPEFIRLDNFKGPAEGFVSFLEELAAEGTASKQLYVVESLAQGIAVGLSENSIEKYYGLRFRVEKV